MCTTFSSTSANGHPIALKYPTCVSCTGTHTSFMYNYLFTVGGVGYAAYQFVRVSTRTHTHTTGIISTLTIGAEADGHPVTSGTAGDQHQRHGYQSQYNRAS